MRPRPFPTSRFASCRRTREDRIGVRDRSFNMGLFLRPPSIRAWLGGCWLNRPWINGAYDSQRQDRLGLRIHLFGGLLCCLTLSFPYGAHELVLPFAAAASLIRITMTWRLLFHMLVQPVVLVGLAWLAFRTLSLAWTPDRATGLIHLGETRYMLLILALWPLMEYRTLLILAYLAGMLVGNLVQLGEGIGLATGWTWLIWESHAPGRITGWWRPAFGGASLCVPMAIWLHAGFLSRSAGPRWRTLAHAMSLVTLLAILASGTRSAWISAGVLLLIVGAVRVARMLRQEQGRGTQVDGARGTLARTHATRRTRGAVLVVLGVGAAILLVPTALPRIASASRDIQGAIERRDFDSDTGARLLMWIESARALRERPIAGVGEGGFRVWARADAETWTGADDAARIGEHAHGTLFHVAATGGLIGLGFYVLLTACALRSAWGEPRDGRTGLERSLFLAIVAITIVGQFETLHVGSRLKQHFWLLLSLSPAALARQRWGNDADTGGAAVTPGE